MAQLRITWTFRFILLFALLVPHVAAALDGKDAGYWTWAIFDSRFPYGNFLDKAVVNNHNWTAGAIFTNRADSIRPRQYTRRAANLIARRIGRWNRRTGGTFLLYPFNRWYRPWTSEGWRELMLVNGRLSQEHHDWIIRLSQATEGLDLIWGLCLEPAPEQRPWLEAVAALIDEIDDRPISHNGNWPHPPRAPPVDLYDAGVVDTRDDFLNTDHDALYRREFDPSRQVQLTEALDSTMPFLVVTEVELRGKRWGLEDWGGRVADWDHSGSWAAVGRRTQEAQPEPEPPDYEALARAENDLAWWWRTQMTARVYAENTPDAIAGYEERLRRVERQRRRLGHDE